jgi:hypothetical protein
MPRIDNIQPNAHMKAVLAIIANAATSKIAAEDITGDINLQKAAQLLVQIGAISYDSSSASFTETGTQLAQDENIIDGSGALTVNGIMHIKRLFKEPEVQEAAKLPLITQLLGG